MRRRAGLAVAAALLCSGAFALGAGNTVSAYTDSGTSGAGTLTAASDWTAPSVSAAIVGKAAGGDPGYVRANGGYYIYANVADTGNPAAGILSVQAAISALSSSPTTTAVTAGSWVVGGVTYGWRSPLLTAKSTLVAGTVTYTLTSTDRVSPGNARTQSFTTTADNTAPSGTGIKSANGTGGIVGRPERNDTVTYTTSEPLDANSVLPGWDGTTTDVQAAIYYDTYTGQDLLLVGSVAATSEPTPIGIVSLGRSDYVPTSTVVYFGASGTRSTLTRAGNVITLVLGTSSSTATTAAGLGTMRWTPDNDATDRAGNAPTGTVVTESNAIKDF